MEKVEVHSTSNQSAICSDIVIRETDRVRLVFRPEIVDNPHEPAAAIKGRFLYQKKAKNDTWEPFETIPLSSIKQGEGYQLEIKSGELLPLLHSREPKCVVIAGSAGRDLDAENKRRSFERFRERITGVTLLTFDEVFERVSTLISLFEDTSLAPTSEASARSTPAGSRP
jgi:hypothetical protein